MNNKGLNMIYNNLDLTKKSNFEINVIAAKIKGLIVQEEIQDSVIGFNASYNKNYPDTIWCAKAENGKQIESWQQVNYCAHWDDCGGLMDELSQIGELSIIGGQTSHTGITGFNSYSSLRPKRAITCLYILVFQGE